MRGLIHRCTVARPLAGPPDPYGHATPAGTAPQARSLRCRLRDAADSTDLLVSATADVLPGDHITGIESAAGGLIANGPFVVLHVSAASGRAGIGYRRLQLQRVGAAA